MNKRYYTIFTISVLLITLLIPMSTSIDNQEIEVNKVKLEKINKLDENLIENISFLNNKYDFQRIRQNKIDIDYTLKGYIIDKITNDPIPNAKVFIIWRNKPTFQSSFNQLSSSTDVTGFYTFDLNLDNYVSEAWLHILADNYFDNETYLDNKNRDVLWVNISLLPGRLPESGTVKGRVINTDGEPINNAFIFNYYWLIQGNYSTRALNFTYTNDSGFYKIKSSPGLVVAMAFKDGYIYNGSSQNLSENMTITINITLESLPPEKSIIQGYVVDNDTGFGINNTRVRAYLYQYESHYNSWYSYTDSSGFYEMNISSGEISVSSYNDKYFSLSSYHYSIDEYEVLWYNVTLTRKPPETSVINGYIFDNKTGLPIEDALIDVSWFYDEHSTFNLTFSNSIGYYSISIAGGTFDIFVVENDYFTTINNNLYIGENETMQIDFYLIPHPIEKSQIHGYIFDNKTSLPINNARIFLSWDGGDGLSYSNSTRSNESGYYRINAANGSVRIRAYIDDYFTESSGYFNISDYEDVRIDFYLDEYPPENSLIYGFIVNKKTGEQIFNARISMNCEIENGHTIYNYTSTDKTGFYSMNVTEGFVSLSIAKNNYYRPDTVEFNITKNETIQINFLLSPMAPENSRAYGFVTDNNTGLPIDNASVTLYWRDDENHNHNYQTYTDEDGYYSIKIPAGIVELRCYADKYYMNYTEEYIIGENEDYCINISLDGKTTYVMIFKPFTAFYVNNIWITRLFFRAIIVGDINIAAGGSNDISSMELYIDGILKYTIQDSVLDWSWTKKSLIKHRHILKVIGYDEVGNKYVDRVIVKRYF